MMMELRWLLIIIGIIIIVAVYVYSRHQYRTKNKKDHSRSLQPRSTVTAQKKTAHVDIPSLRPDTSTVKHDKPSWPKTTASPPNNNIDLPASGDTSATEKHSKPKTKTTELVILHVAALPDQYWQGTQLMEAATKAGLTATDKKIFQYFHQNNSKVPLFHVANKTKPGTFEWQQMEQFKTQGLSLFIELPVFLSAQEAFLLMHACAQRLAKLLGGEILDVSFKPITQNTIDEIHRLCRAIDDERNSTKRIA